MDQARLEFFFENIYFKSATIEAKTYSLIIAKNKLQKK
jgi:hypothetical protein